MKIYIDTDFKCHTESAEGRREFEVPFFDGKCSAFINGYQYVPLNETWISADGTEFKGEMTAPWKDYNLLAMAQQAYDESQQILNDTLSRIEGALGL